MRQSEHDLFVEADRARKRGDLARATEIYEGMAKQGQGYGLVLLGSLYARGDGIPVDLDKAETLFNRAAALGSTEAILQMANVWYDRGDLHRYFLAFQEAASKDLLVAQYFLARCYLRGRGVAKDKVKALELFRDAADRGLIRAKMQLARRLIFRLYNPIGAVYGFIKLTSAIAEGVAISAVNSHDERVR